MSTHKFEDKSYGIGHVMNMTCPCKPEKAMKQIGMASGRASRQGYRVEETYYHHILPEDKR